MNKNLYGILAKYPQAGKVKTRLAKEIGDERAAKIYKIAAESVFRNTSSDEDADFDRIIFYSPPETKSRFESWIAGEKLIVQKGRDIGDVMENALKDLFDRGASKAIITGVDIPDLDRTIVSEAFLKLEDSDVVIGPAEDGGYFLIGMKTLRPEIFQGIPWSTGEVFNETVRIIERLGLSYSTVRKLSDVDRIEDIRRYENFFQTLKKNS